MNREFISKVLKSLGVEEDKLKSAVDEIMAEHGKGIEGEKAKTAKVLDDLKAKTAELDTTNKTLKEMEAAGADSAKVKEDLEKLQAKIAEDQKAAEEKAELDKLYSELDGLKPENMKYLNEWSEQGIKDKAISLYRAEPTKGLKHFYNSLIKDEKGNYNEGIFSSGVEPGTIPPMGDTHQTPSATDSLLAKAMGLTAEQPKGDK